MNSTELSKNLISCFPRDPLEKHLLFNLMYWLAEGKSLLKEHVARRLGYSTEKLTELLKALPGVEIDAADNVFSVAGLSVRETPYPMDGESSRIYARSALDAVVVPTLLLKRIGIEHRIPSSPSLIHLRFGFDQAFSIEPQNTVITFPSHQNFSTCFWGTSTEFIFFPSSDRAMPWLAQHPEGGILSVKDVFMAAAQLRRSLMDSSARLLSARGVLGNEL